MAAADGMQNKIHPGEPLEFDPYHTEAAKAEASKTNDGATTGPRVPVSLEAALLALENDGEFLFRGDVFPPEVLESWIAHKRLYDVQYQRGPGT